MGKANINKSKTTIMSRAIVIAVSCIMAAALLITWLISWFTPLTVATPIFLMMSRPEISKVSKNLMLGNKILYLSSPMLINVGQSAWDAGQMVYGMNKLCSDAKSGYEVYYDDIYTQNEKNEDERKKDVSLYCFHSRSTEKRPYVIMAAGGAYSSVCTPWESLPVCAAFNEMGYTAFAVTYRTSGDFGQMQEEIILEDISRAISYITNHAEEFNIIPQDYLIGGFSAGAHFVSTWCNEETGYTKYDLPAPAAVCLMYGMNTEYKEKIAVPSFIRFCNNDPYFKERDFIDYTNYLKSRSIEFDYKTVNAPHGFGLGMNTDAYGWAEEAEKFWLSVIK